METFSDKQFNEKGALLPFLKRIFTYAMRQKKWVYSFAFWVIMVAVSDAVFPISLQLMIDEAIVPQLENLKNATEQGLEYTIDYAGVYKYAAFFLVIAIVQLIGIYYFVLYTGKVQEYVLFDLRKEMF